MRVKGEEVLVELVPVPVAIGHDIHTKRQRRIPFMVIRTADQVEKTLVGVLELTRRLGLSVENCFRIDSEKIGVGIQQPNDQRGAASGAPDDEEMPRIHTERTAVIRKFASSGEAKET